MTRAELAEVGLELLRAYETAIGTVVERESVVELWFLDVGLPQDLPICRRIQGLLEQRQEEQAQEARELNRRGLR